MPQQPVGHLTEGKCLEYKENSKAKKQPPKYQQTVLVKMGM